MSDNPFLIGGSGPSCLLPPEVCRLLEVNFGRELAEMRTRLRGSTSVLPSR
jgi:hypothetical protein